MKAPAHGDGAGSRGCEAAAARRGSSETSPHWTEAYLNFAYAKDGDDTAGFNCFTFLRHVELKQFGIKVPFIAHPEKLSKLLRTVPAAVAAMGWERVAVPRSGDAVLMAHWSHPSHAGVYVDDLDDGRVLHCAPGVGSVLHSRAHLRIANWRIIAFYRPVDMAPNFTLTDAPALEVASNG